jgi:hypothetical protein
MSGRLIMPVIVISVHACYTIGWNFQLLSSNAIIGGLCALCKYFMHPSHRGKLPASMLWILDAKPLALFLQARDCWHRDRGWL